MTQVNSEAVSRSFTQLPHEMQLQVFQYVPTFDLLWNVRLVSQSWHQLSTPICQNRGVKCCVKRFYKHPQLSFEANPFTDVATDNIPWSGLNLDLTCHDIGTSLRIANVFGINVKDLTVILSLSSYRALIKLLKLMPNLEALQILSTWYPRMARKFTAPAQGTIRLPKLKKLGIHYKTMEFAAELLDFIINGTGAVVSTLHLQHELQEEDLPAEVIHVIAESNLKLLIPNLNYCPLIFETLSEERNIHAKLKNISVQNFHQWGDLEIFYEPLENLLSQCLELKSLTLFVSLFSGFPIITKLRIPTTPALQDLNLRVGYGDYSILKTDLSPLVFAPLGSAQFPRLVNLRIKFSKRGSVVDVSKIFSGGGVFETVKFLELKNCNGGVPGNWVNVFPNVVNLIVYLETSEALVDILKNAKKLVSITLAFKHRKHQIQNWDNLLAKAFESISTFQVQALEILHVKNYRGIITNVGVMLFNLIHPLNLTVFNVFLSKDCISHLQNYHNYFELNNSSFN